MLSTLTRWTLFNGSATLRGRWRRGALFGCQVVRDDPSLTTNEGATVTKLIGKGNPQGRGMVTRRHLFKLAMGFAATLPLGLVSVRRGTHAGISLAEEMSSPAKGTAIEDWMTAWMSVSKAPGGMLKISRFREPVYFLTAPISWTPNAGQERYSAVTVPQGFVTDFASIPRVFWSALRPDGEYAYAAVVHDYLYWTQTRSREEADNILKMVMEDFDVGAITVEAIYGAVRVGGKAAWNGNAEKRAEGEQRILTRYPQDPRTRWEDWKQRPGVFDP